jgi:hypothetical protein
MHTRNVNVKTAAQESSRKMGENQALSLKLHLSLRFMAMVSYAWNVLEDLKAAGASYTRRNIIADMFPRLGVK